MGGPSLESIVRDEDRIYQIFYGEICGFLLNHKIDKGLLPLMNQFLAESEGGGDLVIDESNPESTFRSAVKSKDGKEVSTIVVMMMRWLRKLVETHQIYSLIDNPMLEPVIVELVPKPKKDPKEVIIGCYSPIFRCTGGALAYKFESVEQAKDVLGAIKTVDKSMGGRDDCMTLVADCKNVRHFDDKEWVYIRKYLEDRKQ